MWPLFSTLMTSRGQHYRQTKQTTTGIRERHTPYKKKSFTGQLCYAWCSGRSYPTVAWSQSSLNVITKDTRHFKRTLCDQTGQCDQTEKQVTVRRKTKVVKKATHWCRDINTTCQQSHCATRCLVLTQFFNCQLKSLSQITQLAAILVTISANNQ